MHVALDLKDRQGDGVREVNVQHITLRRGFVFKCKIGKSLSILQLDLLAVQVIWDVVPNCLD